MSLVIDKVTQVKVVTRPSCQPCKATLRRFGLDLAGGAPTEESLATFAETHGYPLTIIDSSVDSSALELAAQLGYATAPIIVVYAEDGTIVDHWGGFDVDRVDAVLGAN